MRRAPVGQATLFGDVPVFDRSRYLAKWEPHWVSTIAQNLGLLLDQGQPFRPADQVPEVYGTVLGKAWTPHVRAAAKQLYKENRATHPGTGDFWQDELSRP